MGRSSCCSKEGLNRGTWSAVEDQVLIDYINNHGEGKWGSISKKAGLKRCGKSCRLRWLNYLRPDIKRGNISPEEEDLIIRLHKLLGNRWSLIAGRIPGRTDNEIKNYWNSTLAKKLRGESEKIKKNGAKSASESENRVVRTKAVRFSGFSGTEQLYRVVPAEDFPIPRPVRDFGGEDCGKREEEYMDSQNLAVEFNAGELLVADISDSEFWKLCEQFDDAAEGGGSAGGYCVETASKRNVSGQFSDEMLTEWIRLDGSFC